MNIGLKEANPEVLVALAPRKRGQPFFAWVVILAASVLSANAQQIFTRLLPANVPASLGDRAHLLAVQMQGQIALWMAEKSGKKDHTLDANALALNTGPVSQRLRFIALAGELAGPGEALHYLDDLDDKLVASHVPLESAETTTETILRKLYGDYEGGRLEAPSVSPEERARLRGQLGWFGELALAPAGGPDAAARAEVLASARRTALVLGAALLVFGALTIGGVIGLAVLLSLVAGRQLQGGLRCGYADGAIYAETFAWWMVVYMGLSLLATRIAPPEQKLLWSGGAMLLSLGVLIWPVLRGIPWQHVRQQIGLVAGRDPTREPVVGVAGYVMTFPLLAVALVVIFVLIRLQQQFGGNLPPAENFGESGTPTHPVIVFAASSDWWQRLQVLLVASVVAPVVEETMFRGVLYRHLREATSRFGSVLSVLLSATCVSFLFAVIHPQGWLAIPALMTLAFTFALMREWRVSLVPSMVAHALNNGAVMLLIMLALAG